MRVDPANRSYTATTHEELSARWDGKQNFLLAGECVPFDYAFPPIEDVVDMLRKDSDTRIQCSDNSSDDDSFKKAFIEMPIEQAMSEPFAIANFKLTNFTSRGDMLSGLWDGVMDPWMRMLARCGFTWFRCYPILFISSSRMHGNYHMDASHVVPWQIYGTKIFNGFVDAHTVCPLEKSSDPAYRKSIALPDDVDDSQVLSFEMPPGTVLWNQILTPHWVDAGEDGKPAMSLNISHGGLRNNGKLSEHGQALEDRYVTHPDERF